MLVLVVPVAIHNFACRGAVGRPSNVQTALVLTVATRPPFQDLQGSTSAMHLLCPAVDLSLERTPTCMRVLALNARVERGGGVLVQVKLEERARLALHRGAAQRGVG